MLQKILNMRGDQGEVESLKQLNLYMVIACVRKLAYRVCHPRSMPFFEALNGVDLKGIDFDKAKPNITPDHSEIIIDNECLGVFLENHPPEQYKRLIHAYKSQDTGHFYSKDTFEEFHQLLLCILNKYQAELQRMDSTTGHDETSKDTFKTAATRVCWTGFFLHRLNTGAALRMHLQTIRESLSGLATSSLPRSQENEADIHPIREEVDIFNDGNSIAHHAGVSFNEGNDSSDEELLDSPQDAYQHDNPLSEEKSDDGRYNAPDGDNTDGSDEFEHASEEEDPSDNGHAVAGAVPADPNDNTLDDVLDGESDNGDEDEDEFEEVKSKAGYLATLRWMKLLVSQFNSAYLLIRGLLAPHISLQILKSPRVGADLMPWKELLSDGNFFPTWSPDQHRPGSRIWNNQEIAKFLRNGINSNRRQTIYHANVANNAWGELVKAFQSGSDYQSLFDLVIQKVTWIQDFSKVPGCKLSAKDILQVLKGNVVDILARTSKVTSHLLYILDVCRIFGTLAATHFKGSLHCETALGTLISTPVNGTHPQYSSLLAEMQVSHAVYDLHPVFHFG
jgi:hypothetical protein